jgi:hypothetical protein
MNVNNIKLQLDAIVFYNGYLVIEQVQAGADDFLVELIPNAAWGLFKRLYWPWTRFGQKQPTWRSTAFGRLVGGASIFVLVLDIELGDTLILQRYMKWQRVKSRRN